MTSCASLTRISCAHCGRDTLHAAQQCVECKATRPLDGSRNAKLDSLNVHAVTFKAKRKAGPGRPRKVQA